MKAAFNKGLLQKKKGKYDNCRLIVEALSLFDADGATVGDILAEIRRRHPDYPSGNATTYLRQLQEEERGGLVRLDHSSSRYSFADPLYRAYAQLLRDKPKAKQTQQLLFRTGDDIADSIRNTLAHLLVGIEKDKIVLRFGASKNSAADQPSGSAQSSEPTE